MAANILARVYESPLLAYTLVPTIGGQQEYPIPRTAFENRLEKVEVQIPSGVYNPVKRISYRDATLIETPATTTIVMYYSEIGDVFRLYPRPTGSYPIRVWFIQDPLPLVVEQGTVTQVLSATSFQLNAEAAALTAASALTTTVDEYSSYINFVDGTTGGLKGTCQVATLPNASSRIMTIRATPTRATVLEHPVSGSLPANLEADDLICTIDGTCIAALKKPFSNYLITMAVSELKNTKLGEANEMAEKVRAEMEQIVHRSWAGRESYMRVTSANPHWQRIGRSWGNRY